MKTSILSVVLDAGEQGLRQVLLYTLAACVVCIVPARAQEKPPDATHAAGWVVIPVDEYKVLRAKAYPAEPNPEPPPVEATLTRVDYDLHVAGELAEGRADLTVDVLKDGWVRVPIPRGLLVREARLDGKLVSLVPSPQGKSAGQLSALLSRPGRLVLALDIDVPVTTSTGDESISLPSTDSGVTRASVELPHQGIDLRIDGGILSEKAETSGQTKWIAFGRGNEALTLTWRKKTEDHHIELPLRMRGSLTQLTSLGEDSTSVYAEVGLEIVQGAAREARLQVPEKVTINQVSGAMVADWEMKNGELAISFLEPVEHSARFVINGEAKLPKDGVIDVPLLRLLNLERETGGGIAVEILGAGEIKDQKAQGLEDTDATDLGEMIASRQSPAMAAFRSRAGEPGAARKLTVNVARYDQQAVLMANVEEARYDVLMSSDGKELVQARYAVRNNQRNFMKITLPPGASVWSASLGGRPARPGQSPDGSLLLPLEKSRGGEDAPAFVVELMYVTKANAWQDKGKQGLTLPALDLPISRTGLLFYYPPMYKVSAEPGIFRTQEYQAPVSAALAPVVEGGGMGGGVGTIGGPLPAATPAQSQEFDRLGQFAKLQSNDEKEKKDATQALLDSFKAKSTAGKVTGILPVNVDFPAFGPSIYLVSELTSENQSPAAEFNFQHEKKGGAR